MKTTWQSKDSDEVVIGGTCRQTYKADLVVCATWALLGMHYALCGFSSFGFGVSWPSPNNVGYAAWAVCHCIDAQLFVHPNAWRPLWHAWNMWHPHSKRGGSEQVETAPAS